jgi:hypothetical protein
MNSSLESFDSLWEYCTSDDRAIPRDWNQLWQLLKDKYQKPSGGWEPPLPLILAAWDNTTLAEKQSRFKEHVQWAADHAELDNIGSYLRSLQEEEWFHIKDL